MGRVFLVALVMIVISPCLANGRKHFWDDIINSTAEVHRLVEDFNGSNTEYSSENVLVERKLSRNNGGKGTDSGGGGGGGGGGGRGYGGGNGRGGGGGGGGGNGHDIMVGGKGRDEVDEQSPSKRTKTL
uniref:Eggshell protein 2A-like n=1 Tax=Cicer arietinum TaxID=3827 RepID=A0A1S2YT60_CICAR|nr:eggshell protein 2A-like [Cicer arietinum]